MKLHVIATAFRRPEELKILILSFRTQTFDNWNLRIIHDGPPPEGIEEWVQKLEDPRVEFDSTKVINGFWGHPNRQMLLQETKGDPDDYVLITNDDNYYVPTFVEKFMVMCNPRVGMVFCNTLHNYFDYTVLQTRVKVGAIDMGSFIVKLDLAQQVGFNHTVEVADGIYAEECAIECQKRNLMVIGLPKTYFVHN